MQKEKYKGQKEHMWVHKPHSLAMFDHSAHAWWSPYCRQHVQRAQLSSSSQAHMPTTVSHLQ